MFTLKTWARVMKAVAEARSKAIAKVKKDYPVLVDQYRLIAVPVTKRGTPKKTGEPLGILTKRTKLAVAKFAERLAAKTGQQIVVIYDGWVDGTSCLPNYAKGDKVERVAEFGLEVYRSEVA